MDYREAGVDVEAGRQFVQAIGDSVKSTYRPGVLGALGGFSGLFELPTGYRAPVLVAGTDGVGTKLKVANALHRHDTVGIDLVAMCVNDVLTCGAEPLFFLDYLATSCLNPQQLAEVVKGIAAGCRQANCALIGGETAEMPGFYPPGDYDLAGFCVGIVEKDQILDGSQVQLGDVVIGLASSGVHSNGFSLVRKIMAEGDRSQADPSAPTGYNWQEQPAVLQGQSLGDALIQPTQIYVRPVLAARQQGLAIHGMAHITGGGLPENLPRSLGSNQAVKILPNSWPKPPIFHWLASAGQISPPEMFNTFNMGIGFAVIVPPDQAQQALSWFKQNAIAAYKIGQIIEGEANLIGLSRLGKI
ncbi:MAG: phosphoribosylformylglycinamidine cyclo-ligase [Cyanobacteria bacterium P01_H01_bin.119]